MQVVSGERGDGNLFIGLLIVGTDRVRIDPWICIPVQASRARVLYASSLTAMESVLLRWQATTLSLFFRASSSPPHNARMATTADGTQLAFQHFSTNHSSLASPRSYAKGEEQFCLRDRRGWLNH